MPSHLHVEIVTAHGNEGTRQPTALTAYVHLLRPECVTVFQGWDRQLEIHI